MVILFIVTSFWAYGEITIACEFALRVKNAGYKPYFLIPPSHDNIIKRYGFNYTTLIPRHGKINRILLADLEHRLNPQLIILADFLNYNFCERHYGLTPEDLSIFSGKLGTFDNFDWAITSNKMDTYGFKAKKFGEIDIRRYGFSLCPCPIVNPKNGIRENTYHYSLTNNLLPYKEDATDKWKQKLGLPTNKKLILFTHATWQESYKQYPDVDAFVKASNKVFYYVMKQLAKDHTVLCIGAKGYFSQLEEDEIMYKEPLLPEIFDQHLLATDLFISRNIVSTSLARAVLSGIPSVNFENSIYFSKKRPLSMEKIPFELTGYTKNIIGKLDRSYPYRMFPVGWYKFLSPVIKNNPYVNTFISIEQFDTITAVETINRLVENQSIRDSLKQKTLEYRDMISELPNVEKIIEDLILK